MMPILISMLQIKFFPKFVPINDNNNIIGETLYFHCQNYKLSAGTTVVAVHLTIQQLVCSLLANLVSCLRSIENLKFWSMACQLTKRNR